MQEINISYLIHNYFDLDEITEASKLFNQFDLNDDGKISMDELYQELSVIPGNYDKAKEIESIFKNIDTDNNNYIEFEEFLKAAVDKKIFLTDSILRFAFNYFDKGNDGEITFEDISVLFKENVKSDDVNSALKTIIDEVDKDKDGKVTCQDVCQLMVKMFDGL